MVPSKMNLEEWFKLAESSERKDGKPMTAGSIIRASIDSLAASSEGGKRNWLDMVDTFVKTMLLFVRRPFSPSYWPERRMSLKKYGSELLT